MFQPGIVLSEEQKQLREIQLQQNPHLNNQAIQQDIYLQEVREQNGEFHYQQQIIGYNP